MTIAGTDARETAFAGKGDDRKEDLRPVTEAAKENKTKREGDRPGLTSRVSVLAFSLLVVMALYVGWEESAAEWIVPESGIGYALGIAGGAMMLFLLLYPLRKKTRLMRDWGSVKYWFRAHMIMGVAGPVLIMYHSNYALGAMNSNVALVSMLIVAGSGLVGRYLHAKVHKGLYGAEIDLKDLKAELEANMGSSAAILAFAPEVRKSLLDFDAEMLKARDNAIERLAHFAMSLSRAWRMRARLGREIKLRAREAAVVQRWSAGEASDRRRLAEAHLGRHIDAALALAAFSFNERMLALWHLFHFPLFIMMVLTAIIHVIAVHMY